MLIYQNINHFTLISFLTEINFTKLIHSKSIFIIIKPNTHYEFTSIHNNFQIGDEIK